MSQPKPTRLVFIRLNFFLILLTLIVGLPELPASPPSSARQEAPPTTTSPVLDRMLSDAVGDYRAGKLDSAIARLREAQKLSSTNPHLRLLLGLLLYEKNPANPEAQPLMESVAEQFPKNQDLQLRLLDSSLILKKISAVSRMLERLQPLMIENARFAFNVTYTLVRYGQIESAKGQLDKISARLQPKLKGLSEQELRSPAHQALQQEAGEVSFISGLIAATSNNKNEALRLFQAADHYNFPSTDSIQMQMLAEALYRMEEYHLSRQAYEVYLRRFPSDAGARMHLAMCYYFQAMFENAKENYLKVLEQAPQTPNVNLYIGMTLLELKSYDEARKHFQKELKADPQSYQAMAELAFLSYLDGDDERCRQWLEKAQPLNPDWVETNMVFGLLYNRLGQFDRAVQSLEKAVREKPDYYKAHFQLSLAYRRSGNESKAKEHADIYDRLVAEERSRALGDRAP